MAKHTTLRRAVRYALLTAALPTGLHLSTAVAQETPGQPEEMTVTGSRIVQTTLESARPGLGETQRHRRRRERGSPRPRHRTHARAGERPAPDAGRSGRWQCGRPEL